MHTIQFDVDIEYCTQPQICTGPARNGNYESVRHEMSRQHVRFFVVVVVVHQNRRNKTLVSRWRTTTVCVFCLWLNTRLFPPNTPNRDRISSIDYFFLSLHTRHQRDPKIITKWISSILCAELWADEYLWDLYLLTCFSHFSLVFASTIFAEYSIYIHYFFYPPFRELPTNNTDFVLFCIQIIQKLTSVLRCVRQWKMTTSWEKPLHNDN